MNVIHAHVVKKEQKSFIRFFDVLQICIFCKTFVKIDCSTMNYPMKSYLIDFATLRSNSYQFEQLGFQVREVKEEIHFWLDLDK
jgi:hypothetical protein